MSSQPSSNNTSEKKLKTPLMELSYNFTSKISILTLLIFVTLQNIFTLYTYGNDFIHIYPNIQLNLGLSDYSSSIITITPWLYMTLQTPNTNLDPLLMLLNSIGGITLTLLTWIFAITIGQSNKIAFSAGLIILSSLLMIILPYITLDCLLFAILTLGALLCLYQGWKKESSPFWLISGFLLTAMSGLTGGIIGFIIPCFSSLIFLSWSGRLRRAGKYDGALAFGLMLIMVLIWASIIGSTNNGRTIINVLVNQQFIDPLHSLFSNIDINLKNTIIASIIWLPWIILLVFLPWEKAYSKFRTFIHVRKTNHSQNWLWAIFFTSILALIFINTSEPFSIIALYPTSAILTAQGLYSISTTKSRWLYLFISIYFLLIGLILLFTGIYPFINHWLPINIQIPTILSTFFINKNGIFVLASVFILLSIVLLKFTNRDSSLGSLFVVTLWTIPILFLFAYYTTQNDSNYYSMLLSKHHKKYIQYKKEHL